MRILRALNNILLGFYSSVKRFPITIGLSTAAAVIVIILSEIERSAANETTDWLTRVAMTLAIGVPLTLCIQLLIERYDIKNMRTKATAYLIGGALLLLYLLFLLPDLHYTAVIRYTAFSIALYLAFIIVPYFYRRDHFEPYVIALSARYLVTALYSFVLVAGISIILFTMNTLLNVPVSSKVYFYFYVLTLGIFAPGFFLAGVPAYRQHLADQPYPKLLKVLLLNILSPLIIIYTAILYIYFIGIVVTLQWPEGLVSHLVLWYSIVSIGVILYIAPIRGENKWARMFSSWFPRLNLPILIMMFFSIGIRIQSYGVTENRYFVVLAGLWAFGIMTYLALTKKPRSIRILTILACVAILSVAGPWSAFPIAKHSQNQRFERILLKNNMIQNHAIVKPSNEISNTDRQEILGIIAYFDKTDRLKDLNFVPPGFNTGQTEDVFGFPYETYYGVPGESYFSIQTYALDKPINIKDYDYLIDLRSYNAEAISRENDLEVIYNNANEDFRITVSYQRTVIYDKPLAPYIEQLLAKYPGNDNPTIGGLDAVITDQTDQLDLAVVVLNAFGSRNKDTLAVKIKNVDCYLLVKVK